MNENKHQKYFRWVSLFSIIASFVLFGFAISLTILVLSDDYSQTLLGLMTAWSSIILALVAFFSLKTSNNTIIEMKNDRQAEYLRSQLDEFYSLISVNKLLIENLAKQWAVYYVHREESYKIINQIYLKSFLAEENIQNAIGKWYQIASRLMSNPPPEEEEKQKLIRYEYLPISNYLLVEAENDRKKIMEKYHLLVKIKEN